MARNIELNFDKIGGSDRPRYMECLNLLNKFLQEGCYPISTEECNSSINESVKEYFSFENQDKYIENRGYSVGGLAETILIISSSSFNFFERSGKKYKVDYSLSFWSEYRIFEVREVEI